MSLMIAVQPTIGPALVVGGGTVAARKVRALADAEFRITVVSPQIADAIRFAPFVKIMERAFQAADFDAEIPFGLVFACTDDRQVNRTVGEMARARGIPVVVVDAPAESTFFSPAVLRDGDLLVGVSTGGAAPTVARQIRERLVAALGPAWQSILATARTERAKRQAAGRQ